jgi:hypothetical protein
MRTLFFLVCFCFPPKGLLTWRDRWYPLLESGGPLPNAYALGVTFVIPSVFLSMELLIMGPGLSAPWTESQGYRTGDIIYSLSLRQEREGYERKGKEPSMTES